MRGIRVESLKELKERISQYINQINEKPVIFKWKYKIEEKDEMSGRIMIYKKEELIRNRYTSFAARVPFREDGTLFGRVAALQCAVLFASLRSRGLNYNKDTEFC